MPVPLRFLNCLGGITEGGWSRTYGYDRYGHRRASGQNVFINTPQNESDFEAATNRLTSAWADGDYESNQTGT